MRKLFLAWYLANATVRLERAYQAVAHLPHLDEDCPKCKALAPFHYEVEKAKEKLLEAWV